MKKNKGTFPSKDRLIMGIHAIYEVLTHSPQRIVEIYTEKEKGDRKLKLLQLAEKKQIPIRFVTKEVLSKLVQTDSHQSFVALVKERNYLDAKQFLLKERASSLVLMLDQIFDPQNFGAILRVAECFGADAVLWSKNRGCDLTPAAAKTSSGASELMPLIRVSNLAETVVLFQKNGYDAVCAEAKKEATDLYEYQFSSKTLLILGSEGEGIQPLISKKADSSVFIPLKGKIESLNVAGAAAVLLSRYASLRSC